MVELTAVEAAERGLTNVTVEVQDAQEPRLEPASFDVVLSSLVVFFLPEIPLRGKERPALEEVGVQLEMELGQSDKRDEEEV